MSIATKPSAADLIMSMGKAVKTATKKVSVSIDATTEKAIDDYFEHDRLAKSHKSMAETCRDQVIAGAKALYYDACKLAGKALSSIKVGKGTMTVTNNYSLIDASNQEALQEAYGVNYDAYFRRSIELSVNKESSNDDTFLNDLLTMVGPEFFQRHFVAKTGIRVTDALHTAIALDAKVREATQPFLDQQVIKPYSPSLKLA